MILPTFFIIAIIISVAAAVTHYKFIKNSEKSWEEQIQIFKSTNSQLKRNLQHTELRLKEAVNLGSIMKKEHSCLRQTNSFFNSAIREKVRKKKIRGKRRKLNK